MGASSSPTHWLRMCPNGWPIGLLFSQLSAIHSILYPGVVPCDLGQLAVSGAVRS